ncbi:Ig-like domain-containing protein [Prevotellaceae bacterium HUN156]|nr:Ig-like domain-containing protein [Prevotellaceae bacterium HUN156]
MKKLLYLILMAFAIVGCARMGSPDGGWYDDDPPRIIGSTPGERATGVKSQKVTIYFDEFIKLADATQNVIVSPPQLEMPEIAAKGKKIVVELKDTLKPDMTYTIDFSDAISDNNEENPLGNYTFTFSTGEKIDTFEVSGYVINAEDLEPVQGILVGLYEDLADSAFRTKPLLRVSRTDDNGHFVIKGVAPGEYRVYALQDVDGDYKFSQKSEMIAFSHETFKPSAKADMRQDTIWRDTLHIDSIRQVPYIHYYPDELCLLAFQEQQTDRYLLKTERKDADRIQMFFSYGHEQLPIIHGLNFNSEDAFVLESNAKKDSLTYWIRDSLLVNQDTLTFSMEYLKTDSLGQLVVTTDTISALAKTPYAKRLKDREKEYEAWHKLQEKKRKREEPFDSIFPVKPLMPDYDVPQAMDPDRSIYIKMPSPLATLDTAAIHLYSKIDTLWYQAPFEFRQQENQLRSYELLVDWHPDTEYSFEVDSAAFVDIYGLANKPYKQGIKVKSLDDYGTLFLELNGIKDSSAVVVQLLDKSDKVVATSKMEADGTAQFYYLKPAIYYARAFVDRNGNGLWDTGNYDADQQAESVYYYPREIEAKAKWDITLQWQVEALLRYKQKPSAVMKKKNSSKKKQLRNRNADRARSLGIEYVKRTVSK